MTDEQLDRAEKILTGIETKLEKLQEMLKRELEALSPGGKSES